MDIPGFNNPIAQQFTGLPMEDLIGGPMSAVAKANYQLKVNGFEKEACKTSDNLKNQYINYMKDTFSCEHDFSSSESSDSFEFICSNGKLFSRVYKRKLSTFGFDCDFDFWSVDLKMDEENWKTVVFFPSIDLEKVYELTESSYNNVK